MPPTRYKICGECKIEKPSNDFYKDKQTGDGLRWKCKECKKKEVAEYAKNNVKVIDYKKGYYQKYARNHKDKTIQRQFGINIEKFEEMLIIQNNLCAICGKEEVMKSVVGQPRKLSIDHCHKTGKVRQLLCGYCNTGLGSFKEDLDILQKAIDYIKKHA